MNRKESEKYYARALELMPGGVNSPVRAFRSVGGTPLFFKSGSGSRLTDEDGNSYIDYCMSWGPLILGHARAEIVEAVKDAAGKGTSFGAPHRGEIEIAEIIMKCFPSMERLRLVNSGTEAVMSAVRLARGFTGRDRFIKFDGCYHGHADYLLVAAGSGLADMGIPDSAGVTKGNAGDTVVLPYNDPEALERRLKKEDIAAVLIEPVACNNGLVLPEDGYLRRIRELCDKYGSLLIFDEVITGFRLAAGGAQEYYGVKADISTLGKIIGGGLPVGAYGGRKDIMAKIAPEGPVYQAGTLSGNPLAAAAGLAALRIISAPGFYKHLAQKAESFEKMLAPGLEKYRGRLLFTRIESVFSFSFTEKNSLKSIDDVKKCDMKLFAAMHRELLERGVYLAPSGWEVGFLSDAHTEGDLRETAAAVGEALKIVLG